MKFYNPDEIRAIPLLEIARRLGLTIEHGHIDCLVHWGTTGAKHRTCSLQEDDNYFRCPCGNSGWTTDLVMQVRTCDIVEATSWIGATFGLTPVPVPKKTDYMSRSRGIRPVGS